MNALAPAVLAVAAAMVAAPAQAQNFHYVEPGEARCTTVAPGTGTPRPVSRGVALRGRLHVGCGFEQGSYTVTLNATDPAATFTPKTFLVNFGRLAGNGAFTVTFASPGVHVVSTAITSNMGSPALRGRFVSADNEFQVLTP